MKCLKQVLPSPPPPSKKNEDVRPERGLRDSTLKMCIDRETHSVQSVWKMHGAQKVQRTTDRALGRQGHSWNVEAGVK